MMRIKVIGLRPIVSTLIILLLSATLCSCSSVEYGGFSDLDSTQEYEQASIVRVIDGDTLVVRTALGTEERLRLIGIDAPESIASDQSRNTEEGRESAIFLKTLVSFGDEVWLTRDISERDKYDRLLRYVWLKIPEDPYDEGEVANKMLNGVLVAQGYAKAHNYEPDSRYRYIFKTIETG